MSYAKANLELIKKYVHFLGYDPIKLFWGTGIRPYSIFEKISNACHRQQHACSESDWICEHHDELVQANAWLAYDIARLSADYWIDLLSMAHVKGDIDEKWLFIAIAWNVA